MTEPPDLAEFVDAMILAAEKAREFVTGLDLPEFQRDEKRRMR
jgi:hypothetical protein